MIWFLLAPLDLFVNLLAFPLAPIIVVMTNDAGRSPWWAWPWLTPDNPIDGDAGHVDRWIGMPRWMRRIAWLWRNRGYGFSTRITGRTLSGPTHFWGDRRVSDNPTHFGVCWAYNAGTWEAYAFYPLLLHFGLRIRLGWKIPLTEDSPNENASLVTHISIRTYQ